MVSCFKLIVVDLSTKHGMIQDGITNEILHVMNVMLIVNKVAYLNELSIAFFIGIFKQLIHAAIKELTQFICNGQFNSDGTIIVHAGQCISVDSCGIDHFTQL